MLLPTNSSSAAVDRRDCRDFCARAGWSDGAERRDFSAAERDDGEISRPQTAAAESLGIDDDSSPPDGTGKIEHPKGYLTAIGRRPYAPTAPKTGDAMKCRGVAPLAREKIDSLCSTPRRQRGSNHSSAFSTVLEMSINRRELVRVSRSAWREPLEIQASRGDRRAMWLWGDRTLVTPPRPQRVAAAQRLLGSRPTFAMTAIAPEAEAAPLFPEAMAARLGDLRRRDA